MMKLTYYGTKKEIGHCEVFVKEEHVSGAYVNYEIEHVERHSPDGFQWGYGGSGPADLALSILTDYCKRFKFDESIPEKYYQKFKKDFIASSPDELNVTSDDIKEWLKNA